MAAPPLRRRTLSVVMIQQVQPYVGREPLHYAAKKPTRFFEMNQPLQFYKNLLLSSSQYGAI